MITIYILSTLLLITTFLSLFYGVKFHKVKRYIFNDTRTGFYEVTNSFNSKAIVYVEELEKYDNGMSKIKRTHIEYVDADDYDRDQLRTNVKKQFSSLIESNKIEWLEVKKTLKDIRKEKLKQINKFK